MSRHSRQKSTYCGDASNCVALAADIGRGAVLLRESENPATVLTTSPAPLHSLIRTLKRGQLDASPT